MRDNRDFESARDLYHKARAAKGYGFSSIGGSNGTITETFGHRESGIPNTFTHVKHPVTGWTTFVGQGTPEIKKAKMAARVAGSNRRKKSDRPATPKPAPKKLPRKVN
jgi:hypothetical protein